MSSDYFGVYALAKMFLYFDILTSSPTLNLGEYKENRSHNHLVHKQTPNHLAKPAGLAKWVSVCLLSGSGFESLCSHLNFRYGTCFGQGVP